MHAESILLFLAGVVLMFKGAEWVTDSASHLAEQLHTTSVAVGLILVSLVLSLPEIFVAGLSILKDHPQIGLGTILGSVIVNIGLIAGVCSMVRPLKISRVILLRDTIFMIVATIIVAALALEDSQLSRIEGVVFILLFVPYLINVYQQEHQMGKRKAKAEGKRIVHTLQLVGDLPFLPFKVRDGMGIFILGAGVLLVGAQFFTDSLIHFSQDFGVPDLVVGITLGALGPSLPNFAAALSATRRGLEELAISETIGSNIFTLLVSVGLFALFSPIILEASSRAVTVPALLLITFLFMGFTIKGHITRREGAVLFLAYLLTVAAEVLYHI
ncbi:MAG: sodium:calcium antiporter [Candidatus Micrarchaeota archaeon]|nr:sodium:calcium antiporter [Candidatus Micrarchaeota archaeon]